MESRTVHLIFAWATSALAFALAFVAWMVITAHLEGATPPARGYWRVGVLAFGAGLVIQLFYGGLLYVALSRIGLFNPVVVAIAYLIPVVIFSWYASNTFQDLLGTIPWLVFALVVSLVFWFFAPPRLSAGTRS